MAALSPGGNGTGASSITSLWTVTLMAVPIASGRRFEAAAPRALFQTGLVVVPSYDQFDVSPDGRFLITTPADPHHGTVIDIYLNWQSALKR